VLDPHGPDEAADPQGTPRVRGCCSNVAACARDIDDVGTTVARDEKMTPTG
jgi:hypothetical protein